MHTIIFEDDLALNFHPLTLTRPAFDLTLGTTGILEGLLEELRPESHSLVVREYLTQVVKHRHKGEEINPNRIDGEVLFVNGLSRLDLPEAKKLLTKGKKFVAFSGEHLLMAKVGPDLASEALIPPGPMAKTFPQKFKGNAEEYHLSESCLIEYPWELIDINSQVIERQLSKLVKSRSKVRIGKKSIVVGPPSKLIIEDGAEVVDPVSFDTREGHIHISSGATVLPFTRMTGPCFVGRDSRVLSAIVGTGTTLGDFTKVGGEVERSIICGYSNKAHEGFLGHSYVGEWVNIGALTTSSDLKNTYGTVKVMAQGRRLDTGRIKVGCFLADNVKTSVGTYIHSGKKVGVASHLHGYVTEDIPSFTIYAKALGSRPTELELNSAMETQRRMMERRGQKQVKEEVELLRTVFEMTQEERYRAGVIKGRPSF